MLLAVIKTHKNLAGVEYACTYAKRNGLKDLEEEIISIRPYFIFVRKINPSRCLSKILLCQIRNEFIVHTSNANHFDRNIHFS
jgi:hypothetical protein